MRVFVILDQIFCPLDTTYLMAPVATKESSVW